MIAVSHPTGNQFVRALLSELEKRGELARFFTTVKAPGEAILRWLPGSIRDQISRRAYSVVPSKITAQPFREMLRLVATSAGIPALTKHETGYASLDAVYHGLDEKTAAWISRGDTGVRAVHCYEDGALQTFEAARKAGIKCVYELPIAYWEAAHAILNEEAARLPEWEPTLFSTRDSNKKLERKSRELKLADVVICPSRFVMDSLPGVVRESKKCVVANFGSPVAAETRDHDQSPSGKLRVLFAGSMTQRKGLADVFSAMKMLGRGDVELVVMGSPLLPMGFYRGQFPGFTYEVPRPHDAVIRLMQTCDVLVLPSLVEGRALVQQEALACGVPLVVTANAGGEDLIEEGVTGFLVPIRSPEAIAEKIAWFAGHRDLLPSMRKAAKRKAAEYTWSNYADSIIASYPVET